MTPKKVFSTTARLLKSHPVLFLPFIIFAVLETIAFVLIYSAPRFPISKILGPPIRAFWGERFLHYPANFLLLPKLDSLSRMVLGVAIGSLLTGMAVGIIFDIYNKKQINLGRSFKSALKDYISLFIIVFIVTALLHFSVKIITQGLVNYFITSGKQLLFLRSKIWVDLILFCVDFLLLLIIQSAFIYAIPLLIIEKENLFKSIGKSFALFKRLFIPTVILVGLPVLIYIPIIILNNNTVLLINKFFPEFVAGVVFLGIIISSLVIDPLVTISTTVLYLKNKEERVRQ